MPKKDTFLWQLSGQQFSSTSYLFGSMHVQDLRAFSKLESIKKKLDSCDAFAAEFHLGENQSGASIPPMPPLKTLMSEKRYQKLKNILLKSVSINLDHFQQVYPMMLTGLIGAQMLGREMPHSLDEYLWKYAEEQSKELLGIETIEEQVNVLKSIALKDQVKMLIDIGKNIKQFRHNTLHYANLYEKGELQRLSKSVVKNAGKLRKVLLYRRNEIMAERIVGLIRERSVFTTVGAGHLGGGKGVLRLLKHTGIDLKPIHLDSSNANPIPT